MIGYYVHHVGSGHLHRAQALATVLGGEVAGLSSLPRPDGWVGEWVRLPRDDDGTPVETTAGGRLHWAPVDHSGMRARSAALSAWIERARPELVVVDVSVEVALLVRLHGVRVVTVVLPGRRDDGPHRLGIDVSDALVGFWPPEAGAAMLPGLPRAVRDRVHAVGALSRLPSTDSPPPGEARVVVMLGTGGHEVTAADLGAARRTSPSWSWEVLGTDRWVPDPGPSLRAADVVVTHAGQNALAEVAACRRPAVVVPQRRPHDEQGTTGRVLRDGDWPALVVARWPRSGWSGVLAEASTLDPARWAAWCDGRAAWRFRDVLAAVRAGGPR